MLHARQLSSMTFLLPTALAARGGRLIGTTVYALNWAISTATHSVQDPDYLVFHAMDLTAIAVWGVYNTCLVAQLLRRKCVSPMLKSALALAVVATLLHASCQSLEYESEMRTRLHMLMHTAGALGSVALLVASNSCPC